MKTIRPILALGLGMALGLALSSCEGDSIEALAIANDSTRQPTAADVYEAGNGDDTPGTASYLPIGASQARTIFPIGDKDYVRVNLTAGVTYEFQTDRLSPHGDTYMRLFDPDGTTLLTANDDYNFSAFGYGSGFQYTPGASGTYFLQVETLNAVGVTGYTLGARIWVDADADGYSTHNDCADSDSGRHPLIVEVAADGIDQNCDGVDAINPAVADSAEPDDTPAQAKPMALETAHEYARVEQAITFGRNARTIASGETDYFSITVPAYGVYFVNIAEFSVSPTYTVYQSDGVTIVFGPDTFLSTYLYNPTGSPAVFYVRAVGPGGGSGRYVPMLQSYGTDVDGDGYYSADWAGSRDCNDNDPSIHPFAVDVGGDGVDSNCDGVD